MEKSNDNIRKDDLALYFASSGYYRFVFHHEICEMYCVFLKFSCQRTADCTGADSPYSFEAQTTKLNSLLDNAPASFEGMSFPS